MELKADKDYGGAAQPRPGGCYRLVYDDQGKLTGCPGVVNASWWLRVRGPAVPGEQRGVTRAGYGGPMETDQAVLVTLVAVPRGIRPDPSLRATADDPAWGRWVPAMWQAVADPQGRHLWLGDGEDLMDEVVGWAPAVHLLAYSLGWPRIDLGLARWMGGGRPPLDERFALLDQMLGERIIELAAWFATSSVAVDLVRSVAFATRTKLDLAGWRQGGDFVNGPVPSPFGGGGDPLHLFWHTRCAIQPYEVPVPPLLLRDDSTHRACLILDVYQGWYRALARTTTVLAPVSSRQTWTVEVICRPVGHLGLYRRCPYTGRWFAGSLSAHLLGSSLEGASGSLLADLWPDIEDYMAPEWEETGAEMLSRFVDSRREE